MEVLKLETWINEFGEDQLNLDKLQEYLDFIVEAIDRYDPERYSEWHHVVPKCIDLEKKFRDQGVRINGSDHFRAHMKLVECFSGEKKRRLSYAAHMVSYQVMSKGEIVSFAEYERSKKVMTESFKEMRKSQDPPTKGFRWYNNGIVSIYLPPNENPPEGFVKGCIREISEETRDKMSKSGRGRVVSQETRDKHREIILSGQSNFNFSGRHHSEESKNKISQSNKNKLVSEETRKRMSESAKRRSSNRLGKTQSEETRRKITESCKVRKFNLICKRCGSSFISSGSRTRYCENCSRKG